MCSDPVAGFAFAVYRRRGWLTRRMTDETTNLSPVVERLPAPGGAFGERLRAARLAAGLSQRDLAGDELHSSYVSLLESGHRPPTVQVVTILAKRLGVTPDELLGEVRVVLPETVLLAGAALATGRPTDAVAMLADIVPAFSDERMMTDVEAFRAGELLATALERSGRVVEAVLVWERLRAVAAMAPARLPMLPVVRALVRCYRDSGDVGRAIELGERAVGEAREMRVPLADEELAAVLSTLAGAYSERGDHLRARTLLDELVAQTEADGSRNARGYALWNAAITATETGRAGDGRRFAERASGLLAEGADARAQAKMSITRAWVLLAQDPPEATEARRILRAGLPALRQDAGAVSVASAETELARCELFLGRPEVAQRHATSALRRLRQARPEPAEPDGQDDPLLGRARALTALGAALVAQGDTSAGLLELEGAAGELRALGAPRQAAAVWRQLSGIYRALDAKDEALAAAEMAMDGAGLPTQAPLVVPSSARTSSARSRSGPAHAR